MFGFEIRRMSVSAKGEYTFTFFSRAEEETGLGGARIDYHPELVLKVSPERGRVYLTVYVEKEFSGPYGSGSYRRPASAGWVQIDYPDEIGTGELRKKLRRLYLQGRLKK